MFHIKKSTLQQIVLVVSDKKLHDLERLVWEEGRGGGIGKVVCLNRFLNIAKTIRPSGNGNTQN